MAAVALVALLVAVYADYRSFDRTSGGYEPPYDGWSGTPIDWSEAELTATGFRRDGLVVDNLLDCRSGMITFRIAGITIDFRKVSPRAIAVHQPREACRAEGFTPRF